MTALSDTTVRPRTLLSEAKLCALRDVASSLGGVAGDVAELGVYRGGSARLLAKSCPDRTVHLFDTFAGIPSAGFDPAMDGHYPGEFSEMEDEVRRYLADCPNVRLHPGVFPETAVDTTFALVHLDADLYASTRAGLEWFWPRLSVSGAIVLDDWRWRFCRGVDLAVTEFFAFRGGAEFVDSAEHQLTVFKR